jgi:hypothetical protein
MNKTTEALKLAEEALVKANRFHDYEDELAAAAPDLLEALQRILPQYEALLNDCGLTSADTTDLCRAAIAKAIRAEALEEAAKVCDSVNNYDNPMTATDCAEAIRGLK